MNKKEFFEQIKGKVIVSCQALPGEPLYVEEKSVMYLMARAGKQAEETGLPVIGLIKVHYPGFDGFITPTMKEVDALAAVGSDVIAMDCTLRKRGDGKTVNAFIAEVRQKYPDAILMADISTYDEGVNAWKQGMDIVGTTMSGYTDYSPKLDEPDYELVRRLSETISVPVIGEGKVHYPDQAVKMLEAGAHAVVVGGAITRPLEIASRFMAAVNNR